MKLIATPWKRIPLKKYGSVCLAAVSLLALTGVLSCRNIPLKQNYSNPAYGLSFNYPDGWAKKQDSMNRAFPTLSIDTALSDYFPSDGSSKDFVLNTFGSSVVLAPPPGENMFQIYVNTGNSSDPVWKELSVGREGVDTLATKDCLLGTDNQTLTLATAPPRMGRAVRVDYSVGGWSALVAFGSPDGKCFVVVDASRLTHGQSFSDWSKTWETSPKTNEGKPPFNEHYISSGGARVAGLPARTRTYTDSQAGGRQCTDYAFSANGWTYEVLTYTVQPVKYSDWQPTVKAILASLNVTAPDTSVGH